MLHMYVCKVCFRGYFINLILISILLIIIIMIVVVFIVETIWYEFIAFVREGGKKAYANTHFFLYLK